MLTWFSWRWATLLWATQRRCEDKKNLPADVFRGFKGQTHLTFLLVELCFFISTAGELKRQSSCYSELLKALRWEPLPCTGKKTTNWCSTVAKLFFIPDVCFEILTHSLFASRFSLIFCAALICGITAKPYKPWVGTACMACGCPWY